MWKNVPGVSTSVDRLNGPGLVAKKLWFEKWLLDLGKVTELRLPKTSSEFPRLVVLKEWGSPKECDYKVVSKFELPETKLWVIKLLRATEVGGWSWKEMRSWINSKSYEIRLMKLKDHLYRCRNWQDWLQIWNGEEEINPRYKFLIKYVGWTRHGGLLL